MRRATTVTRSATLAMMSTFVIVTSAIGQVETTAKSIGPEAIRAHTTFLADDLLQGRGTGTQGFLTAALYVATQFELIGLEPGSAAGNYFQPVPLRHSSVISESTRFAFGVGEQLETLRYGDDFYAGAGFWGDEADVTAEAVFVGHGVVAPALNHDDYGNLDVRGKIVVTLPGAPMGFPDNPAAHYSSGDVKARAAAERGAVGFVSVWQGALAARFPWPMLGRFMRRGSMRWLDANGAPNSPPQEIRASATVTEDAARRLFANAPTSFDQAVTALASGERAASDLNTTIRLRVVSDRRDFESPNIVARLTGSDPTLRDEYVVYTAHVDHEGLGEPVNGDSIYNGAIDNAGATAALIEIGRAFTELAEPPARSILFVGTTGEEEGLLGADYFANNPPVPVEQIVANVNMDGNHMLFPVSDIIAFGDQHSSLGTVVRDAAGQVGVAVSPDPMPEQTFFIRSDHYPFVKQGIPAVFLVNGFTSADETIDGGAVIGQWMTSVYHTPLDDLTQTFHWESGAAYARIGFLTGHQVAVNPARPTWNDKDFFGETFGRQRRAIP